MEGIGNGRSRNELSRGAKLSQDVVVASRREAFDALRLGLEAELPTPILLTGDSGAGKSWLLRKLVETLPAGSRLVSVQMSPDLGGLEFLELILGDLGGQFSERLASSRLELSRLLEDEARDGRKLILVVENAQHTRDSVWAELHAIVHAMEDSRGFAGLVLTGTSELVRLLRHREHQPFASRVATHRHLLPFDLAEARELLETRPDWKSLDREQVEILHRDSGGNPRRFLHALRSLRSPQARLETPRAASIEHMPEQPPVVSESEPTIALPVAETLEPAPISLRGSLRAEAAHQAPPPPLIPSRPPLRMEEGMIEVGWSGSLDSEEMTDELPSASPGNSSSVDGSRPVASHEHEPQEFGEELIEDHYAALQAWAEWAENRDRVQGGLPPSKLVEETTMKTDFEQAVIKAMDEASIGVGVKVSSSVS